MPNLRRWFLTTAAVTGGMTAYNTTQDLAAGPLASELPGQTCYWRSPLGMVFYKTLGQGEPLVLVHGFNAGASSYEMRRQVAPLAERFKVYAFDWPGFGLSERPGVTYTAQTYTDIFEQFMREVVADPAHVIASSLASAYVIYTATRAPDLFRRLVLIAPTGIYRLANPPGPGQTALRGLVAAPVVGSFLFNLLASRPSLRFFLNRQGYLDPSLVTDAMLDAYFVTTHQPGARFAPASFVSSFLNLNIRREWIGLPHPTLIVWGRHAISTPVTDAESFLALRPETRLEVFDEARLLPHDEQADRFNALAADFLSAT